MSINTLPTSNVNSRHQGPKQKLPTGYTAPSLQHMSCLCILLLCCASCIFNRQVWYCALSLCMRVLCMYLMFGHHPLPYATLVPNFVSVAPPITELARGEKSRTQSITHLI